MTGRRLVRDAHASTALPSLYPNRAATDRMAPVTDPAADTSPLMGVGGRPQLGPIGAIAIAAGVGLAFWVAVAFVASGGSLTTLAEAALAAVCLLALPFLLLGLFAALEWLFPNSDLLGDPFDVGQELMEARFMPYRPGRLIELAPRRSCSRCSSKVEANGMCSFHWERWMEETYDAIWDDDVWDEPEF